jgi:hypothetical protein
MARLLLDQPPMSKSSGSPIPIDRTRENIDQRQRADEARERREQEERYRRDQGVDDRPGVDDSQREPTEQ